MVSPATCDKTSANGGGVRPVTVLYLIDCLCGVGGGERALLTTVRELPRSRFRPIVVTFRHDPAVREFDELGSVLRVLPLERTYDLNALRTGWRLRRLIRDKNVRIVHTFFETSDLWGGAIAKLSRCPIVISSRRDMGILRGLKHRVAYRALRFLFDQVHTVSEEVREMAIRTDGLRPERVVTIYNGVDPPPDTPAIPRRELYERFGIRPEVRLVVTVANVRPVKGLDVLIRAAARVCATRTDVVFVIVGDIQDERHHGELLSLATELCVSDRVKFWGHESNVPSLLRAAEIFCLLSRNEGFSNAILEAMACGLPSVVSRVGGNAEAIEDGCTGYVVAPGDARTAADRLLALLDDSDRRLGMGAAALRASQEKFSTARMMDRLTTCYDELLQRI